MGLLYPRILPHVGNIPMSNPVQFPEMIELSPADKEAVRLQIERLLSSSHFRNSRRYTDLLRFVVQQTLQGHADILKERTLGIEVFGRERSFDTSGDSIVRVAAAEVRKRIALYYREEGHERELRIELPSGSYVPHFRRPLEPAPTVVRQTETIAPAQTIDRTPKQVVTSVRTNRATMVVRCLFIALVILAGIGIVEERNSQKDLLEPLWKSPQNAILCIGSPKLKQNQPGANGQTEASLGQPTANNTLLPFADAMTLSRFQVRLNTHGKPNRVELAGSTTFADLRAGPTILIGAFDNPWTLRLTSQMRFRFLGTDETEGEIIDSKSNSGSRWSVDFRIPYWDRTQDYAIVAITHDATLDQPLIITAGIGPNGTAAAGEFLLSPDNLAALVRMAPAHWSGKNVEVVLATQVIQGNSGPPRILASEYW
jgi:hypothetical protein